MTLTDLLPLQPARIVRVDNLSSPAIQRLMVLGLVEGAELTFVSAALGGDPLEFRLFGSVISLRKEQASSFVVEPMDDSGD